MTSIIFLSKKSCQNQTKCKCTNKVDNFHNDYANEELSYKGASKRMLQKKPAD